MSKRAKHDGTRDRIMAEADPLGLLIDIAAGRPIAELDWDGEVLGHLRPPAEMRMAAIMALQKKVVPDLKPVDADAIEGGTVIQFVSPVPLPNSAPPALTVIEDDDD
jgi:hypothetical protein